MKMQKIGMLFFVIALIVSSVACGLSSQGTPEANTDPTQPPAAASPAQAEVAPEAELGHIVGVAHGVSSPTPALIIYAIEVSTNEWVSVQTPETEGEASFKLDVKPGTYVVFSQGLGYPSIDELSLGLVNVASGQTVSSIEVRPPGQSECGAMFGIPASPDGRYPALPGPTDECLQRILSGEQAPAAPSTKPSRIEFAAGTTSVKLQNRLASGGLHPYVLGAMAGQEMGINLTPGAAGILSIWGADGTILMKEEERGAGWRGIVPTTQDYYIDVISISNSDFDYALDVYVSALSQTNPAMQVFPRLQPFDAAHMLLITKTGQPTMLPPNFPAGDGLPAIVPYLLFADTNSYAFSLDYGDECQGAGACHYGAFTAAANSTDAIVGINGFPFDPGIAQKVSLDRGITGYFVESACGANCSDATIWWMYNGYQYSLGLKATRDHVIAMANATINNSLP